MTFKHKLASRHPSLSPTYHISSSYLLFPINVLRTHSPTPFRITMWFKSYLARHTSSHQSTSATIPDEAFNLPSPERQHLLSDLRKTTEKDTVPATYWACLQVCNISKLRQIVNDARTGVLHDYLDTLQDCCRTIPLHWIKRPYGWNLTSGWKSNPSWSAPASPNEHALSPSDIALERDRKRCFMIEMPSVVTPIYPQSMIPWLRC